MPDTALAAGGPVVVPAAETVGVADELNDVEVDVAE